MKTDDLIATLAMDTRATGPSFGLALAGAIVIALLLAAAVFFSLLGPRPDFQSAVETPRFLLKIAMAVTLAITALACTAVLARPQASPRIAGLLALAPALLAMTMLGEMMVVPPSGWYVRWIGTNSTVCLLFIPLIGIAPLAVLLAALRRGAPARPLLSGAVAGLLAGGIGAGFYAIHCPDDSPLFVATWYSVAIALLAVLGAAVGRRVLRW
ncbi:NrsF family protein [Mesorhizobium sp. A623]